MKYFIGIRSCFTVIAFSLILIASPSKAAERQVGVILTGSIPYYKEIHKSFTEELAAQGFGPGSVEIITQTPSPEPMSWTNASRKLVAIGSDVIVSYGAPATLAALSETSDIPIVFAGVYDPQAVGVLGKNATGISSKVPVVSVIKNLKSITNFSTLGVIYNESEKDTIIQANEIRQFEASNNFRSVRFNVKKIDDASKIANVDALFLTTSCAAMHCVTNIAGIARREKIPTATTIGGGEGSVILTIAANPQEQGRAAARIAAKALKGTKVTSMGVEHPTKIDLVVNIKEASAMGLKVPFDLLSSATRVIK